MLFKKIALNLQIKMLGLLNILKHYRCAKLLQRVSNHIYSVSSQFVSFFYQQTFIRGGVPSKTQIILRWLLTGCELFFAWIRIQPLACTENWHHKESRQHYKVKFNDCKRKSIFWFFRQDPNQSQQPNLGAGSSNAGIHCIINLGVKLFSPVPVATNLESMQS